MQHVITTLICYVPHKFVFLKIKYGIDADTWSKNGNYRYRTQHPIEFTLKKKKKRS